MNINRKAYKANEHEQDPSIHHSGLKNGSICCITPIAERTGVGKNDCEIGTNKHIDYTKGSPDSPYFWRITMPMEFVEGM